MHGPRDYGSSSSQSSVESSAFPYQIINPRSQHPPRSDSPNGQRASLVYASQNDNMIHTPQQMLYGNPGADQPSEFGHFPSNADGQSSSGFDSATLRSNSMYGTFGPQRRQGVPGSSSTGMMSDPSSSFGQFPGDVFGPLGGSQQQPQMPNGMRGYDYMNDGPKGGAKSMFNSMDPFSSGNAMLQSQQQLNKQMQQQAQQSQQFHLHNLAGQPFANNLMQGPQQTTSQTPFGPHVNPANNGSALTHANGLGSVSVTNQQEEISTIFVVGFPEDMQVRSSVLKYIGKS